MKSANFTKLFALSLALAVVAVGCKKTPKGITPIPAAQRGIGGGSGNPAPPAFPLGGTLSGDDSNPNITRDNQGNLPFADGGRQDEGNFWADRETFKDQTVYFDYDSSTVRPGEQFKIEAVANLLKSQPGTNVRIEGHCDERGTSEYNRSLGERRALSAREALATFGIGAERIMTSSFGEDKPALLGTGEEVWAKNRRAEFVLLTPKQ